MTKSSLDRRNDSRSVDPSQWATEILACACEEVNVDPTGARLIKFTNNAVFALATAPIVVRIAGSTVVRERVRKVVGVARWLAEHDMPAVRLINDFPQPLHVNEVAVTFWHRVDSPDATCQPDGRDLGRILRKFHSLNPPDMELPVWNPLKGIRQRIDQQEILTGYDYRYLLRICDEVEEDLSRVEYFMPHGPIHGDGFAGNLISGPDGVVICDFDSTALGPREWDLTPLAVGRLRFRYPVNYHEQLVSEYGVDIMAWPYFPVLRRLRELQLVTSVLPVLSANPNLYDQWHHRFTSFRDNDTCAVWTPYK
ncbi:aminoglycoside phosphotransferase family protein [Nocardia sp. NBC_01730]|uniref:phosphotransferase family protein n=1 Tax=Nocardia sp. NBC_01730 TaxID=2975998 RepID=UPI002E0D2E6E|nr:aminoglycoside phosphotransferase family protein [Nocardia sp. NBC_01730]